MMTGLLSYSFAALSFSILSILLIVSRQRVSQGKILVFACVCSLLWAITGILDSVGTPGLLYVTGLTDTLRILAWGLFIYAVLVSQTPSAQLPASYLKDKTPAFKNLDKLISYPAFALTVSGVLVIVYAGLRAQLISASMAQLVAPILWIVSALSGLLLLERLYFSASIERRASLKTLCIGLGGMFALDFFVFTDVLLFRRINLDLWQVRGFFYGLLTPFIALAIARNPEWSLRLHVSRQAVTSSVTILAAGTYLTATAVAAYFIRISGVDWASVGQIALILLALLLLVVMLWSRKLRSNTRVLISKHLFAYKYDYRSEWLKFTSTLAENPQNAGSSIIQGMISIVDSDSGVLWSRDRNGKFEIIARKGFDELEGTDTDTLTPIAEFMQQSGWLIDIDEYKEKREIYQNLTLPDEVVNHPKARLIIPLPSQNKLAGIVLIARSSIVKAINWEDRDLLKTAGHQASALLEQMRSSEALTEARQFEAFNKMSAYIVHDLKNIISQQSLIVSNAEKHKHKPEFVDDVIATIDNSVNRMQSLLGQLRDQQDLSPEKTLNLCQILNAAIKQRSHASPVPGLIANSCTAQVSADSKKLERVFAHLIHNAQDATPDDGSITIAIVEKTDAIRINIEDTGKGMTQKFIKEHLFTPFDSTKGLTGMGIGAYESREYIRNISGSLNVSSILGQGSVFEIIIPLINQPSNQLAQREAHFVNANDSSDIDSTNTK